MFYIEQDAKPERESFEFEFPEDIESKIIKNSDCTKMESTFYPRNYIYHIFLKNKKTIYARILAETKDDIKSFEKFVLDKNKKPAKVKK